MRKPHALDRGGRCLREGVSAESRFRQLARARGWTVQAASRHDDCVRHIDCYIERDDLRMGVDIKARKRTARRDAAFRDDVWWLERTNVVGRRGWLRGDAQLLAMEGPRGFTLLDRPKLWTWAQERVAWDVKVRAPGLALYKSYTRRGREDEVTLVKAKHAIGASLYDIWDEVAEVTDTESTDTEPSAEGGTLKLGGGD